MNARKQHKPLFTTSISHKNPLSSYSSSSRITPDPSIAYLSTSNSVQTKNISKRNDSEPTITSIIDEKVSSLQTKFNELSGLRKKFIENHHSASGSLSNTFRNKVQSLDSTQNLKVFNGKIFSTEDKRFEKSPINEKKNIKTYVFKPNFEELLFDCSENTEKKWANYSKNKEIKEKLEKTEKKLEENERRLSEKDLSKERFEKTEKKLIETEKKLKESEKMVKELKKSMKKQEEKSFEEICQLRENNKILKLQVNRLEKQLKSIDSKKSSNTDTIRNLSYIILSKDSPSKDSPTKSEPMNSSNLIALKYLETLNELHSSDQLILQVLEKINKNKIKEAWEMLNSVNNEVIERLEKTRNNVEELENIVYESKSPLPVTKNLQFENKDLSFYKDEEISPADLLGFLRCEASMIEELLIIN